MRSRGWILAVLAAVAVVLAVLVLGIERGSAPNLVLFAGRFHPAVVHFPIALLLVGALIEILAPAWPPAAQVRSAVPFILGLGALSALGAATLGYLLSLDGGYEPGLLSLHMWLGFAVFGLSLGIAAASILLNGRGRLYRGTLAVLVALVVVTGHLGGSLARGGDYLTYYLPDSVKRLAGFSGGPSSGLIANIDSAQVYADLVQPIFDRRCVGCHGETKSKGNLRLDSREGLEKGGRDGSVLEPGNPARSEIVRRITLPPFHEDSMPPDGEPPLDIGETELIRWWIQNGASFESRFADHPEKPFAVETYIRRVSAPSTPRRSGIFALDVPAADTTAVLELQRKGLLVKRIDPDAPFLYVSTASIRDRFADADFEALRTIAPQIARLDVSNTQVTSAINSGLAEMPHLTHLHLEQTRIDGSVLDVLREHQYLEYLNLYATRIGDADVDALNDMTALSSVFLWQTEVSPERAEELRRSIPGLYVNVGSELQPVDSTLAATTAASVPPP